MKDREQKITVIQAYREGTITRAEAKQLLRRGFKIPPIAWVEEDGEDAKYRALLERVFPGRLPISTWVKSENEEV